MAAFTRGWKRAMVVATLLVVAVPATASLSPKHVEWGKGPAQWIMTPEEQKAWRAVKSDTEAIRFIDLFWVRRDPTPGTPANGFRTEFGGRVAFADRSFSEPRRRGALTDKGRVYIVLGAATNMAGELGGSAVAKGITEQGSDPAGGRALGARDVWVWNHEAAVKFDMPKIEVVFIEDPSTRKVQRDPQRTDFVSANKVAIRKAIVNPDLTEVPSWAPQGGLKPVVLVLRTGPAPTPVEAAPQQAAVEAPVELPAEPSVSDAGPIVASAAPGASRLTLIREGSLNPQSPTDPLSGLTSVPSFKPNEKVSWALQYCSSRAEVPTLKYLVHISGPFDGDSTDRVAKEKEMKPPRLAAVSGCYLMQGSLPLPKLPPGRYELGLLIDDVATGDSFDLDRPFRVD